MKPSTTTALCAAAAHAASSVDMRLLEQLFDHSGFIRAFRSVSSVTPTQFCAG